MRNLICFIILFFAGTLSCKNLQKPQIISHSNIKGFEIQESVVDSFLYGIQNNRQDIIKKHYNGNVDIANFKKLKIKYYSLRKGVLINSDKDLNQKNGDVCLTFMIKSFKDDSVLYYFNLRNFGSHWLITGFSNEIEDQMEIDIQNAIQNLPTHIDSISQ